MEGSRIESARQIVLATLARLGQPQVDRGQVKETTLLRDREHVGRRFQYEKIRAIWFADEAAIAFFDDDGNFLESVAVDQASPTGQAAA
jgi:hypothetical protein